MITGFLNAISLIFKTLSLLNLKRKSLDRQKYPGVLVISIDNLSFGGTGKTTLVIETGKFLEKKNIKFAIVTRGYKSAFENAGQPVAVQPHHLPREAGDEACLFKHRFPQQDVYVGKNRRASIEKAIADNHTVILLDDGFQTANVDKDIKIMLVNPLHPYYYLRNFKGLMKTEDYVLFYQFDGPYPFEQPRCGGYRFQWERFCDPAGSPVETRGLSLFGFSALGDNLRFKQDLSAFNLVEFKGFRDHHAYTEADLHRLNRLRIKENAGTLVCTEKDFIKIKHFNLSRIPLIYAQNSIKFNFDLMDCIWKYAKEKNKV